MSSRSGVIIRWCVRKTGHPTAQAGTGTEDVNEDNDFSAMDSKDETIHANSTAALPNWDPSFTNLEKWQEVWIDDQTIYSLENIGVEKPDNDGKC